MIRLSRTQAAKAGVKKIFGALASFAKAFKVKYDDIEFSVDLDPVEGVADSGDLKHDLAELIQMLGEIARE